MFEFFIFGKKFYINIFESEKYYKIKLNISKDSTSLISIII